MICDECYLKKECKVPCSAVGKLQEIYGDLRTEEKRTIIQGLRTELGIKDAETAEDIQTIAEKIITKIGELNFINELDIKIGYVRSYERKTKDGQVIYGDCRKVSKVYGAYLPYDFVITLYELNIGHLTDNQIKILIWHELKHIDIGDRGFTLRPHDIEDFYSIIDQYGTRWSEFDTEVADILE